MEATNWRGYRRAQYSTVCLGKATQYIVLLLYADAADVNDVAAAVSATRVPLMAHSARHVGSCLQP